MGAEAATVTLKFPAGAQYLRLARLAAADAGSRAGFDVEGIDDLRIAVSEICTLLALPDVAITLAFVLRAEVLEIEGSAPATSLPAMGELTLRVLGAVLDEYSVELHDGEARFRLVKCTPDLDTDLTS